MYTYCRFDEHISLYKQYRKYTDQVESYLLFFCFYLLVQILFAIITVIIIILCTHLRPNVRGYFNQWYVGVQFLSYRLYTPNLFGILELFNLQRDALKL